MNFFSKFIICLLISFDIVVFLWILIHGHSLTVLTPQGMIALKERNLILIAISMGLSIIIPVLIISFSIAWKYRDENAHTKYTPDAVNNGWRQGILWAIPIVLICILGVITWNSTHELDPYKAINSTAQPIAVEVVALRWKWLFIYPQQHIATVNYLRFPIHTPVNMSLTADDAPMNSFWIPGLVGQMYAMTGMKTQLHFLSDSPAIFTGSAAEISGQGFSGMRFRTDAVSSADFTNWVASVKQSSKPLDMVAYNKLLQPSENNPVTFYSSVDENLYNTIIMKYMSPSPTASMNSMNGM